MARTLWPLMLCMHLPNTVFVALAAWQPQSLPLVSAAVALEQFGYGFGFTAVILFMMQFVAHSRYQTAHYALATGVIQYAGNYWCVYEAERFIPSGLVAVLFCLMVPQEKLKSVVLK